jgi:hypothetical protein
MRAIGTVILSIVVIGAGLLFVMCSNCAFAGGGVGRRGFFIVGALVAAAVIVVGIYGITRINQRNVE